MFLPFFVLLFADNTWEPAKDTHCRELIHKFHCDAEEVLTLQIDEAVEMVRHSFFFFAICEAAIRGVYSVPSLMCDA